VNAPICLLPSARLDPPAYRSPPASLTVGYSRGFQKWAARFSTDPHLVGPSVPDLVAGFYCSQILQALVKI
jgi:hypothetical protein